jgi:hypothetical protein
MCRYSQTNSALLEFLAGLQFALSTFLTVDEFKAGVPIASILHSRETEAVFTSAVEAFKKKMHNQHATWRPGCFIVDDCTAALNALRCAAWMPLSSADMVILAWRFRLLCTCRCGRQHTWLVQHITVLPQHVQQLACACCLHV